MEEQFISLVERLADFRQELYRYADQLGYSKPVQQAVAEACLTKFDNAFPEAHSEKVSKKFVENVLKKIEKHVPELADEDFIDEDLTEEIWRGCEEDNYLQLSNIATSLDEINTALREIAQQLNERL